MKHPFSPLVWLCAASALALGALVRIDPNGVYADYAAALEKDTPPVAAVFTAARDGVYPWSTLPGRDLSPRSPAYHGLAETVTDDEMRSSVGSEEPFRAASPLPPAPTPEEEPPEEVESGFVTVEPDWFNDALFIGDSHVEGLSDYGGIPNATFYFKRGLDIWSVMQKPFVNGNSTVPQALSARRFGKIYIMLGINEIGCGTTESYAAQYADVVRQLRELQPEALIFIQSVFHTSQKKSAESPYKNEIIDERNAAVSALADGEHVFFLNCNEVFDDETGAMTPAYTGDGVHVMAPYYTMWRDYLLRFGKADAPVAEPPVRQLPEVPGKPEPPPRQSPKTAPAVPAPPPAESGAVPETPLPEPAETESETQPAAGEPAQPAAAPEAAVPETAGPAPGIAEEPAPAQSPEEPAPGVSEPDSAEETSAAEESLPEEVISSPSALPESEPA